MTRDMLSKFEDLIVGAGAEKFRALERLVDVFCPFEAVGMVSQEIRHSNYLSYILDPNRPHGFGTTLLKGFLELVANNSIANHRPLSKLDLHFMDLSNVQIRREWQNIDLLIEVPASAKGKGLVVAVELKINAVESEDQLKTYYGIITKNYDKEKWNHEFVFLTKRGDESRELETQKIWQSMKLAEVVTRLEDDASKAGFTGKSADLLTAYIEMMRRHHLGNAEIEKIAMRLWSQHTEALMALMAYKPDLPKDLMKVLSHSGKVVNGVRENIIYADKSSTSIRRFCVSDWKGIDAFKTGDGQWVESKDMLILELTRSGSKIFITYCLDKSGQPEDEPRRRRLYDLVVADEALEAFLKDKKYPSYTPTYRGLNSEILFDSAECESDNFDIDRIADEVIESMAGFIDNTLPIYDKIVRQVFERPPNN